jgi:acetyltransferase-like isoleucine patch superfamily enzyme
MPHRAKQSGQIEIISIGKNLQIGDNVKFSGFKDQKLTLIIGDNVRIEDDVRIVGGSTVILSNNVTLHNHISILGSNSCFIGANTWIAQYTSLDCEGGLEIGRDCCIGYNCQIWSHVCRVPRLENMRFHGRKKTVIKDRVWLQGGLITINPGVILGEDCVIFSQSVVNDNTLPAKVYGGVPAKIIHKFDSPYTHG